MHTTTQIIWYTNKFNRSEKNSLKTEINLGKSKSIPRSSRVHDELKAAGRRREWGINDEVC